MEWIIYILYIAFIQCASYSHMHTLMAAVA